MAKDKDQPAQAGLVVDSLIGLLGRCSKEDLDGLDAKIAAKQAEIDQILAGHKAELEGLKGVRAFLAKKLGAVEEAKPKREHWTARKKRLAEAAANGAAPPAGTPDAARIRRVTIARLLAGRGPLGLTQIANETNIPKGSISTYLGSDWFAQELNGNYRLTEYGRREAGLTPGLSK